MGMNKRKLKQKGYMIIEVLLSAAMLTTAIITPMSNIDESRKQVNKNRAYANAIFIANRVMEELKMKDYYTTNQGDTVVVDSDLSAGTHTKTFQKNNITYTVTWTVTDQTKYKEIALEVKWKVYGAQYTYPNKKLTTIRTINYFK